jgi:formylglycine-generating enzyme required for sulfatase activity
MGYDQFASEEPAHQDRLWGSDAMAYDVFISYSAKDKPTADAACAALENAGVRCWIAPRDVIPGRSWAGSIVEAIGDSRVLVLIFSSHSNNSQQVLREVERAVHKGVIVVPFRIEDVPPSADMEYYISTPHWLDALTPPLAAHLQRLCQTVSSLVPKRRAEIPSITPKPSVAKRTATAPRTTPTPPQNSHPTAWFQRPVVIGACVGAVAAVVALLMVLLLPRTKDRELDAASKSPTKPIESVASSERSTIAASTGEKAGLNAGEKGSSPSSDGQTRPDAAKFVESESPRPWQWSLKRSNQAHDSDTPRKLAFLVGVQTYKHSELKDLKYPENDVKELAGLFETKGFAVTLLTTRANRDSDKFPTAENIRRRFEDLLSGASKHDLLVVALAGHGVQPSGSSQSYFCPYDANPSERDGKFAQPDTLLSINDILQGLRESGVGQKLLMVDACRNDLQVEGGRRGGGVMQVDVARLPPQTGVLLSCDQGEFSFESESFGNGHGAFFYEVIEGLNGAARDDEGAVTWESLGSFVRKRVPAKVRAVFHEKGQQNPNAINNLSGAPIELARVEKTRVESAPLNPEVVAPTTPIPSLNPPKESGRTTADQRGDRPPLLVAPFSREQALAARKAWAAYLQLDGARKNSVEMPLVLIPPGQFAMGIEAGSELAQTLLQETPQHLVRISKPFYFGIHEVTKSQFETFVAATHYKTDAERNHKGGFGYSKTRVQRTFYTWRNWGVSQGDASPVVNVSWNDACRFCEWLSQKEGKRYRLPTEAEWEYACRAGTITIYYNGNNPEELAQIGNVADATTRSIFPPAKFPDWAMAIGASDGYAFTAPVGSYAPNNFGLFDMTGNVTEWCQDWFDLSYYGSSPGVDPTGPAEGKSRVIRGGGWTANPMQCRSAARWLGPPDDCLWDTGFRVVCIP